MASSEVVLWTKQLDIRGGRYGTSQEIKSQPSLVNSLLTDRYSF